MNFDLDQLRAFEAVRRHGNFRRAADALGVAQSSLSQQIARLEGQLGRPLFARTTRRVDPTPHAYALHPHAEAVLAAADGIRRAFGHPAIEGVLRVGFVADLLADAPAGDAAVGGLRRALAEVRSRHPRLRLRLRAAPSHRLFRELEDGTFDVVLARRLPGRWGGRLLGTCPLVWCGLPTTLAAEPDGAVPLVVPPEPSQMRSLALAALRRGERLFRIAVEADDPDSTRAAVIDGLGIAALGVWFVPEGLPIVPASLALPAIDPVEYVVDRRADPVSPAVADLVASILAHFTAVAVPARGSSSREFGAG